MSLTSNSTLFRHSFEPDKFLVGLHRLQNLKFLGVCVPAPVETYRTVRQQVRHHLVHGLPEVTAGDTMDRVLGGLEMVGCNVITGTEHISLETRFTATMVLAIRACVGRMPYSDANLLVVQREYRRLCRAKDVRLCVVEGNRAMVEEVYFKEECMDSLCRRYNRLPRWISTLLWFYQPADKFWEMFGWKAEAPGSRSA